MCVCLSVCGLFVCVCEAQHIAQKDLAILDGGTRALRMSRNGTFGSPTDNGTWFAFWPWSLATCQTPLDFVFRSDRYDPIAIPGEASALCC